MALNSGRNKGTKSLTVIDKLCFGLPTLSHKVGADCSVTGQINWSRALVLFSFQSYIALLSEAFFSVGSSLPKLPPLLQTPQTVLEEKPAPKAPAWDVSSSGSQAGTQHHHTSLPPAPFPLAFLILRPEERTGWHLCPPHQGAGRASGPRPGCSSHPQPHQCPLDFCSLLKATCTTLNLLWILLVLE